MNLPSGLNPLPQRPSLPSAEFKSIVFVINPSRAAATGYIAVACSPDVISLLYINAMFAVHVLSNGISRPAQEYENVLTEAASTGSSNNQITRMFPSPFEGIFTHFSRSDEKNKTSAKEQLEVFQSFCNMAESEIGRCF